LMVQCKIEGLGYKVKLRGLGGQANIEGLGVRVKLRVWDTK